MAAERSWGVTTEPGETKATTAAQAVTKLAVQSQDGFAPGPTFRAALTLGGIWTLANRLERASGAVWLARLATLPWLIALLHFLNVWFTFLSDKARLNDVVIVSAHNWVLSLGVASLVLSVPLAMSARVLLVDVDPERQRRQSFVGLAVQGTAIVAAFFTLANVQDMREQIHTAWAAGGSPIPSVSSYAPKPDPYAAMLVTPAQAAEARRRDKPWNGKGIDLTFPTP